MGRKRFGDQNCAIARSLDIFGDGWSLLIIRDAFFALLPILMTLREWGDTWVFGVGSEPLIMHDQKSGKRIPKIIVRDTTGTPVKRRSVRARPGPGADESTHRIFAQRRNNNE